MLSEDGAQTALFAIRLTYPLVLLVTSLSLLTVKSSPVLSDSSFSSLGFKVRTPRRALILSILSLVASTYFTDGFSLVLHSVLTRTWQGTPDRGPWRHSQWSGLELESVAGLLASGLLSVLGVWKESQGVPVWTSWRPKFWTIATLAGTTAELPLVLANARLYRRGSQYILNEFPSSDFMTGLHVSFLVLRILLLLPLTVALTRPRVSYIPTIEVDESEANATGSDASANSGRNRGLVEQSRATYRSVGLGRSLSPVSPTSSRSSSPAPRETSSLLKKLSPDPAKQAKLSEPERKRSSKDTLRQVLMLIPMLWPKHSMSLQFLMSLCGLILLIQRIINPAMPLMFAKVLEVFEEEVRSPDPHQTRSFWPYLLAYIALYFLTGRGGLDSLFAILWEPVSLYSERRMADITFNHLLSLSLAFHNRRKTGELLRILERGAVINRLSYQVLFDVCPAFVDLFIALGVFIWMFDWLLGVVIGCVLIAYVIASVGLSTRIQNIRKSYLDKDTASRGVHTDSLLNYETVKYHGSEAYECERYAKAIRSSQSSEYRLTLAYKLIGLVQSLIVTIGYLVGGIIIALRVSNGKSAPSDFAAFIMYLAQLYSPLNWLHSQYMAIQHNITAAESLIELLQEPTEINDNVGAPDLVVSDGEIVFDNVHFAYEGKREALKGISFKVPKASSVALVGSSGSGKSTVLRLLFRFYDLKEGQGRILIDGQDIRDVTQLSLRKAIGIVPQDSVLFNESIGYNIGYGKLDASSEEIEAAAKAANMHERIMSFPDGYDTQVGERGVRLSGGEKQRVSIARTLLKNPPILMLDEATSALDTSTEKMIQHELQRLMRGRSSLSVAHRLSTIVSADIILVMKDGQIAEQGSHRELLEKGGIFAKMWADQVSTEDPELISLDVPEPGPPTTLGDV